jgi:hypothetical protein
LFLNALLGRPSPSSAHHLTITATASPVLSSDNGQRDQITPIEKGRQWKGKKWRKLGLMKPLSLGDG